MLSKETAVKIAHSYIEIENTEKLMSDMADNIRADAERGEPSMYNAFGERVGLELGVPCGKNSHRLFGVNADLAVKVIEAHREAKTKRLHELMTLAKIEMFGDTMGIQARSGWVDVDKQLPIQDELLVDVTYEDNATGERKTGAAKWMFNGFHYYSAEQKQYKPYRLVFAWMPRPEPYRKSKEK